MLLVLPLHFWVKDHSIEDKCYEDKCNVTNGDLCAICNFNLYITTAWHYSNVLLKRIDWLLFVRSMGIKKVIVCVTGVYISLRAPPF